LVQEEVDDRGKRERRIVVVVAVGQFLDGEPDIGENPGDVVVFRAEVLGVFDDGFDKREIAS
jgi:hypothetical protein